MNMSESVKNLAAALIAVQKALPRVEKDKVNPFFNSRYAGLDTVMSLALKALTEQGLGVSQTVGRAEDGASTLTTILLHESGEWISDTQPLLLVKADPQGQGSAITYARRYAVMSMLGLVAEDDDDGNAASKPPQRRDTRKAPTPAPAQNGSPPVPRDDLPSKPATDQQKKFAHTLISKLFGSDEPAAYEWVKDHCPRACEASPTQIHLTELSIVEASELIMALQNEQKRRQPA